MENKIEVEKVVKRIIDVRKDKGLSLEYVAEKINLSTSAYYKIENLETKLTLEKFLDITNALEVTVAELLKIKVEHYNSQKVGEHGVGHQYNGEIKALYNENSEISKNYINTLLDEINFLKQIIVKNNFI